MLRPVYSRTSTSKSSPYLTSSIMERTNETAVRALRMWPHNFNCALWMWCVCVCVRGGCEACCRNCWLEVVGCEGSKTFV